MQIRDSNIFEKIGNLEHPSHEFMQTRILSQVSIKNIKKTSRIFFYRMV